MKIFLKRLSLTIVVLSVFLNVTRASISLPEIFSDNMVLQRNSEITIWGWAKTGGPYNIHPKNKLDPAIRLANIALNRYYKTETIEDSGPLFKDITIEKNKAIISFDHSDGLHIVGDRPTCFEIAGSDKVFYRADAKIKGQQVIVTSKNVKSPVTVRFAWSNTATPNLFNGANLPASCFKTE
jgi:hypothetical protein